MNPSHLSSPRAHSCCHVLLQGWCIHECPLLPANTHQLWYSTGARQDQWDTRGGVMLEPSGRRLHSS